MKPGAIALPATRFGGASRPGGDGLKFRCTLKRLVSRLGHEADLDTVLMPGKCASPSRRPGGGGLRR
jgi:hypothetical protein